MIGNHLWSRVIFFTAHRVRMKSYRRTLAQRNYKKKQEKQKHMQDWFKQHYDPTNENEREEYLKWKKSWASLDMSKTNL